MAHYLIQVAYTPEAWATMSKNPQDREALVRPAVEGLGGTVRDFFYSFGEYDVICVAEFPSNVDAASFAIGVGGAGAVKAFKTTPLLSTEEGMEAMRRSGSVAYTPPG
ncbi:MAG: GYD domain-containing protein [Actinomycetes bacterium]